MPLSGHWPRLPQAPVTALLPLNHLSSCAPPPPFPVKTLSYATVPLSPPRPWNLGAPRHTPDPPMGARDRLLSDLAAGEEGGCASPEHSEHSAHSQEPSAPLPPTTAGRSAPWPWALFHREGASGVPWALLGHRDGSGAPGAGWGGAGSFKGALQCMALGQVLSLLVTVTAVSSSVLASQGVSIPASQSFLNYLLLAAAYGTPLLRRAWKRGASAPQLPEAPAPSPKDQCSPLRGAEFEAHAHSNSTVVVNNSSGGQDSTPSSPEFLPRNSSSVGRGDSLERSEGASPEGVSLLLRPHLSVGTHTGATGSAVAATGAGAGAGASSGSGSYGSAGESTHGLSGRTLALFALTSFLDVEGNFLVVLAFRYTSLTSVALLDCWAIPFAMLLTSLFLGTRYTPRHTLGALLCTGGLACLLFSDAHAADRAQAGPAPGLGDALVLLGASLYAGSNVLVEHLSATWTPQEVLGALGCGGTVLSLAQLLALERHELQQYAVSPSTLGPLLAFSLALFSFYSLVPLMLRKGGAAFFNLSLLTSDAWAVGVSALWFHRYVGPLYFVALAAVAAGLSLYSLGSSRAPGSTRGGE